MNVADPPLCHCSFSIFYAILQFTRITTKQKDVHFNIVGVTKTCKL